MNSEQSSSNKPREFWILDNGTDPMYTAYSKKIMTSYTTTHVREVVEITDDEIRISATNNLSWPENVFEAGARWAIAKLTGADE